MTSTEDLGKLHRERRIPSMYGEGEIGNPLEGVVPNQPGKKKEKTTWWRSR